MGASGTIQHLASDDIPIKYREYVLKQCFMRNKNAADEKYTAVYKKLECTWNRRRNGLLTRFEDAGAAVLVHVIPCKHPAVHRDIHPMRQYLRNAAGKAEIE